jgi:hypothetical protein
VSDIVCILDIVVLFNSCSFTIASSCEVAVIEPSDVLVCTRYDM